MGEQEAAGPRLLRQTNNRRVFQCVLEHKQISRAEISRQTGISPATVSKVMARLQNASLVEEESRGTGTGLGRPSVLYRPARRQSQIIAVVVDPAECLVAAGGLDCQSYEEPVRFPTPATYEKLLQWLSDVVTRVAAETEGEVVGVGMTAPGQVHRHQQTVLYSPNLHALDGRSPSRDLEQRTGFRCYMFREMEAMLLREWTFGQAVGVSHFCSIAVNEDRRGFGLAAVSGGRLLDGHDGLSGELGHMTVEANGRLCGCGNRGCLETRATDAAFLQSLEQQTGHVWKMEQVRRASSRWSKPIQAAFDETVEYLAIGVAGAINIFNPELVLVASDMIDVVPGAFDELTRRTHARALKPLDEACRVARSYPDPIQETLAGGMHYLLAAAWPTL